MNVCLIVFSWHPDHMQWLELAANRDEFFDRPTQQLHQWNDDPQIIAGRDKRHSGTWLALHKEGWFAALTNIRRLDVLRNEQLSRGSLVLDALRSGSDGTLLSWFSSLSPDQFAPFNLIVGNRTQLYYLRNFDLTTGEYKLHHESLKPGLYGLSNAELDTPWPKVTFAKQALQEWSHQGKGITYLNELLSDTLQAPEAQLPNTGIAIDWEKALSAPFIRIKNYGTLSSAAIIGRGDQITFREITWQAHSQQPTVGRVLQERIHIQS